MGAGLVGLAAGRRWAPTHRTLIVEAGPSFGQGISSRNSEVIHSGIYYEPSSWKTRGCLEGRRRLIEFCSERGVFYRLCGKVLVAEASEIDRLQERVEHATRLGVESVPWTAEQLALREPLVRGSAAVFFPGSGIVDSHGLMHHLERDFVERGGTLAYRHRVERVERGGGPWRLFLQGPSGPERISCATVVNAAGMGAAALSNAALGLDRYEHRPCAGRYLTLAPKYRGAFQSLIYPLPEAHGLGIHVTLDAQGWARLGPDVHWGETEEGEEPWESLKDLFLERVGGFLPGLRREDLGPGFTGHRPKLFVDGVPHRDFLLEAQGGWVHALGVESPGLTAALALGDALFNLMEGGGSLLP